MLILVFLMVFLHMISFIRSNLLGGRQHLFLKGSSHWKGYEEANAEQVRFYIYSLTWVLFMSQQVGSACEKIY